MMDSSFGIAAPQNEVFLTLQRRLEPKTYVSMWFQYDFTAFVLCCICGFVAFRLLFIGVFLFNWVGINTKQTRES